MNLDNKYFEIDDINEERLYANIIIVLFKTFFKESIITNEEYKLLSREIHRTFNLF